MKSSARNVKLASAADLFSTEQERQDANLERVQQIPLSELFPFPDHPFAVRDDDSMKETVESVKEYGVLMPTIARPREGGGYELVAGHRRKRACELAGLDTMLGIMSEDKKPEVDKIVFTSDALRKYFPRSYTPRQMQDTIIKLLESWMKKRQRGQER